MLEELVIKPTAKTEINTQDRYAIGTMDGDVTFEDYKDMLISIGESIRAGEVDSMIINRIDAGKIDTAGRVWLKNVGFKEYSTEANSLKKFAIVKSKSAIGELYANTIYPAVKLFYPSLTIKSFNSLDKAIEWVTEGNHVTNTVNTNVETNGKTEKYDTKLDSKKEKLLDKILNFFFK